jgi:type IV pilus assembly protein PilN
MPRVNLLPWREELRQKRKKEFLLAIVGAVLVGVALTFGTKVYYKTLIANQESRNATLRAEIAELDKQIAEIESFEAQKDRLLDRMQIIEQLQSSRPESVHLMDEVVTILPAGVHLTEVAQENRDIQITGITQSNQRISNMMRSVEESEYLRDAWVDRIETTGSGPVAEGEFRLSVKQVSAVDEEEI